MITAENIYNFDEKGFLIGMSRTMKRIMSLEAYKSGRVTKNKQDGNREFISLLACVSAIGRAIPPLLIYRGANGELQDTWVQDARSSDGIWFGASENGWSNNRIGLLWLQKVFERFTKPKSPRAYRLLIVDGHSSHVNMAFVDFADRHRIIIMVLPPHTTHRLQPLDVGLFQPLSTAYFVELDKLMNKSGGLVAMSKRFFYSLFKTAWEKSFTEKNIQHAFAKPGIWPVNPVLVLEQLKKPTKPEDSEDAKAPSTPKTAVDIRRMRRELQNAPAEEKEKKLSEIFDVLEKQTAKVFVVEKEASNLREAIILEQQKRKKGKRLDLAGKES
jgi:hypothetical protein